MRMSSVADCLERLTENDIILPYIDPSDKLVVISKYFIQDVLTMQSPSNYLFGLSYSYYLNVKQIHFHEIWHV